MTYVLNYTVTSDRGLIRDNNEDSAYAGPNLLVLADGMGGHAAGEVASQIMVSHMAKLDAKISEFPEEFAEADKPALLGGYAEDANQEIADTVRRRPETEGMGTTLTAVLFDGIRHELTVIHAGDSRGYVMRGGELSQLTVDDTFVQSLVDEGKLDPADVSSHPRKSLILKAYTGQPVTPSFMVTDAQPGDRLLLCSDGLSDPVTSTTIQDALRTGTPAEAAQRLIELALRSGGPDNVTIVVADVLDVDTMDEEQRAAIPSKPQLGGALSGQIQATSHPNTAAGRAAAWSRQPRVVPPNQAAAGGQGAGSPQRGGHEADAGGDSDEEDSPRRGRWIGVSLIIVLVIALLGGGWWAYSSIKDSYYVAVNEEDEFIIEQGVDYSIFGWDLHRPIQSACINNNDELRLVDVVTDPPADCTVFSVDDLPESVRTTVPSLQGGSYDEVTQQLRRLATAALPVCLERDEQTDPEDEDLNQPGVNCRVVS